MAADFAPPPNLAAAPSFQKPFNKQEPPHQSQQSMASNPSLSAVTSPSTPSPTSSRPPRPSASAVTTPIPPAVQFQFPTRQSRQPKSPLYIPAVLRQTEKPPKQSPPKNAEPVDSARSSWSSTAGARDSSGIPGSAGPTKPSGHRRDTGGSVDSGASKILVEEWNEDAQNSVTGRPSNDHWQPDSSTLICTDKSCDKVFNFFNRRHHCRRCGGIFCAAHSAYLVRLNQHALFHPGASLYRACTRCFHSFREWEARRLSRSNSDSSAQSNTSAPIGVVSGGINGVAGQRRDKGPAEQQRVGSLAASVSRDWNWSTF